MLPARVRNAPQQCRRHRVKEALVRLAAFFQRKTNDDTASQSGRNREDSGRAFRSRARSPSIAVAEEYELARRKATAEAFELFIARHGDDPMAKRACVELKRLTR